MNSLSLAQILGAAILLGVALGYLEFLTKHLGGLGCLVIGAVSAALIAIGTRLLLFV